MSAPDYEVVGTVVARLRSAITAVSGRVYYTPPDSVTLPYVDAGDTAVRRADGSSLDAVEVDLTIHVWTDGSNSLQDARRIADDIAQALHGYALPLPNNRLVTMDHRASQAFYDVDEVTGHGIVQLTAYVDRA